MSPKLIRLMFVATVVAGLSAPTLGASAAGQARSVDAWNPPRNFEVPGPTPTNRIEVQKEDTVSWVIWEGEHTVTPQDPKMWDGDGSDPDAPLTPEAPRYSKTFSKYGEYVYYCKIHGSIGDDGKPQGMWGVVHVKDLTPDTTAPPTTAAPTTTAPPPPTTATTKPGATPPATTATAPTTRPGPSAPATTPTTAKPKDKGKKKDAKEDETTTTSSTLPPPVDLPNEAIVPSLPGFGAAPGSDAEAPIDTPEGEAVALLKPKKNKGGDAVKLLIVSGLGLGALGVGTAGYKYANRSSKYFPA